MKQILVAIMTVFFVMNAQAQSHNMGANYNCRLKKGNYINSEKHQCPACEVNDNKEKAAKVTEDKRRSDLVAANLKAKKDAEQKAAELKRKEDARNAHSGEVVINAQKPEINTQPNQTSPGLKKENRKYTAKNIGPFNYDEAYSGIKTVQILSGSTVVFEGSGYNSIYPVKGNLFALRSPSSASRCVAEHSNNYILVNEKGERIILPGIDKFGVVLSNRENNDYFDISVYTGKCTTVEDETYAKGDWQTTTYTFSYTTMSLISTEPSWQHANCKCE